MTKKITKNENKLLQEIIESEIDGIGSGYSEFDGIGITNKQKGILSSLIKKGLIYDSMEDFAGDDGVTPMYCTTDLINSIGSQSK
jgi:hypothetical protein